MESTTSTGTGETFNYSGTELEAMAEAHNYCQWILRYFAPYLGKKIVEIGAGAGTFSELLLRRKETSELVLFEAAENLFPLLRSRFNDDRVRLHLGAFAPAVLTGAPDSVVLVNVLEHILDDERLLSQIQKCLKVGGSLLLFVPASQWNFGSLDEAFEHHRRYSKPALRKKLEHAGFRVERQRYVNFMGIASWFLAGKVLRQTTIKPSQVRWYDRWIIPWSFELERFCEPPIGQSLLAVASK
ncbi:MAG TPA: class I SAM-dependent methyltransferase [Candidatus Acidoferrales bacterium]|nr:class I SAM-dependent methyltransferase [Candidatus Acidoferrales bacterium]